MTPGYDGLVWLAVFAAIIVVPAATDLARVARQHLRRKDT